MKKFLASAAVVAIATPAFAGIGIDSRYDYYSATSNSTTSSTTNSLSGFAFDRLIITGSGKATDNVSVKAAINPLAINTTGNATDSNNNNSTKAAGVAPSVAGVLVGNNPLYGPTDIIYYAQAEVKVSDYFTLNAGKLFDIGLSGFEGQENPGDMYFTSQAFMGATYLTGASGVCKFADNQTAGIAAVNNNSSNDSTRMGAGAWYVGTFGNFGVRADYYSLPGLIKAGGTATTATPMTVGVSYKMDDWKFALDYDMTSTQNGSINNTNQTLNSIVGSAKYAMGNWTPSLKLEQTSRQGYETAGSDVTDSLMNWSLAAEYKKNAADPFRYEIAYVNAATTYANKAAYSINNATVTGQYAYLGIRYMGDFLK